MQAIRAVIDRFERFIGIDDPTIPVGEAMRARFVYRVSWAFIAVQVVNWFGMWQTYDGFHAQHVVSLGACLVLVGVCVLLRFTRSAAVYGPLFTVLLLGGVWSATMTVAHPLLEGGINTPLLPLLVMGALFMSMAATWRWVLIYTAASFALVLGLYFQSRALLAGIPADVLSGLAVIDGTGGRAGFLITFDQRFTQVAVSLWMTAVVVMPFGHKLYKTCEELEASVAASRAEEAAKSRFLTHMGHEIRGPLGGIISISDMLARQDLPDLAARQAGIVSRASHQLLDIVNDVLDTARLEAGRLELELAPFDLHATLSNIVDLNTTAAANKGLWLGLDWQQDLPAVYVGDVARLRQIVGNYLGNALKFTDSGGVRIAVRGARVPGGSAVQLRLFVQDTGRGIAPHQQAGVFERFGQSDSGRGQGNSGSGLGLAIVRELATLMGGTVGVTSEPGQGSAFWLDLQLPAAQIPADTPAHPTQSSVQPNAHQSPQAA